MATTTNDEPKLSLAAKLAAIGNELGVTAKTGKNGQQNYDFIEYAVVSGKIRSLLDKYKVSIMPQVDDYEIDEVTNKYGNKGYHYTLRMSFLIKDGESDESFERKWLSEAVDYGDKSINKAETAGTKYFYMRLFNISEKGEKEADQESPEMVGSAGAAEGAATQTEQPEPSKSRLDFDDIRADIKDMDMKTLAEYRERIMKNSMSHKQRAAIDAIIKQRADIIKSHAMGF